MSDADDRLRDQARGTYRNTRELVGGFAFDKVLPPSIADLLQNVITLVPRALGRGSPEQQIYSSLTLIGIAIITAPISLGYSLVVATPFGLTLVIGLYRLNPWVDSQFRSLRGNKLRDRDIPLWERD